METLCSVWDIQHDVAGATFIAFGGSAPEIIVNAITTYKAAHLSGTVDYPVDLGVGAILGSGMIAFLVIPSICSLFSPVPLKVFALPIIRDSFFYLCSLSVLFFGIFYGMSLVGSTLLLVIYAWYVSFMYRRQSKKDNSEMVSSSFQDIENDSDDASRLPLLLNDNELSPKKVLSVSTDHYYVLSLLFGAVKPVKFIIDFTCPDCSINNHNSRSLYPLTFAISLCWISLFSLLITVLTSRWSILLSSFSSNSGLLGFMGIIIVSVGAEIPDTVNALTLANRGLGRMAISSCLGAQVLNICIGLGLPWVIYSLVLEGYPSVILVKSKHSLSFLSMATLIQFFNVFCIFLFFVFLVQFSGKFIIIVADKVWAKCLLGWYSFSILFLTYIVFGR